MKHATRTETDSLGPIEVPADRYYGAQTARSLIHFAIGDGQAERMPIELVHALALLKKAAALVNRDLGKLPGEKCDRIARAAEEVMSGRFDEEFPLRIWQTGSGTQTNMNVNEVIANRAIELAGGVKGSKSPIHPNNDVNMSTSSNDAIPTAMHIAAARALDERLIPAAEGLRDALLAKAREFRDVVKTGRTHLQDAVPLTFGQEIGGWASLVDRDLDRIASTLPGLHELAIGGTAVGTGLNAHPEFADRAAAKLAELSGLPFRSHPDKFAALSAHDEIVFAHAALRTLAGSLMKIANDIRWLASGPRTGLGEITLPENEPGSSIMPGKVNPTQCEAITMVAAQVFGHDATIALAGSQGNLELNVYKPVMIAAFLRSARLLADACRGFAAYCVAGIDVVRDRVAHNLEQTLMTVTALAPEIGYDRAAKLARMAQQEGISLREANRKMGVIDEVDFDRLTDPERMIRP
ncbi:MAG: class II fumarate hydratase [Isosphaeraceae bacterium]